MRGGGAIPVTLNDGFLLSFIHDELGHEFGIDKAHSYLRYLIFFFSNTNSFISYSHTSGYFLLGMRLHGQNHVNAKSWHYFAQCS